MYYTKQKGDENVKFKNEVHKERYCSFIKRDKTKDNDLERQSFFYLSAGIEDLFSAIDDFYNFEYRNIDFYHNGPNADNIVKISPRVTSRERAMMALAFHLFNGKNADEVTPNDLFNSDSESKVIAMNAICIRYEMSVQLSDMS